MRKAKIIGRWVLGKREKVSEPVMFHQWGMGFEEFENGPGNFTTAIVEHPDGRIEEMEPSDIQFTDTDDSEGEK